MRFAYVELRRPISARWFEVRTRTLLFGYVAAVLRYNTIIRLFFAIAARILCIPEIAYFDDFGAPMASILEGPSRRAVNSAARLLGISLAGRKTEVDYAVLYLALLWGIPSEMNGRL